MRTTIACALATVISVGYHSQACAEEPPAVPRVSPAMPSEAQAHPQDSAEATVEPKPNGPLTDLRRREISGRGGAHETVSNPSTAQVGTASPATPAISKSAKAPSLPKPSEEEAPWGKLKPCKNPDSEGGGGLSSDCAGVFGLRGGITTIRGVRPSDSTSVTVSAEGEEYIRRGIWTTRSLHRLAIGGGSAGFDGTLLGGWAGGIRLPIAPCHRHGPLLRVGMYGYLRGNDAYYASLLELPQLQLGYQYMHGKILVELGATTGAVLTGRSRTGDAERRTLGSGFERGGYLAVQLTWLRMGVSGNRLPVNDGWSSPVDVFEGTLCAHVGGVALCGDARALKTKAIVPSGEEPTKVRSHYAGITLGFTRE